LETPADYRIDVLERFDSVDADAWDRLLACQDAPTPFMQHAYLQALQTSDSATAETGWLLRLITVWQDTQLIAACPLYVVLSQSRGDRALHAGPGHPTARP
jgi:predicted N-acyltransferase